jgi:hypothetical protein
MESSCFAQSSKHVSRLLGFPGWRVFCLTHLTGTADWIRPVLRCEPTPAPRTQLSPMAQNEQLDKRYHHLM